MPIQTEPESQASRSNSSSACCNAVLISLFISAVTSELLWWSLVNSTQQKVQVRSTDGYSDNLWRGKWHQTEEKGTSKHGVHVLLPACPREKHELWQAHHYALTTNSKYFAVLLLHAENRLHMAVSSTPRAPCPPQQCVRCPQRMIGMHWFGIPSQNQNKEIKKGSWESLHEQLSIYYRQEWWKLAPKCP